MKTLLVDGHWNLKRNFFKKLQYVAKGEHCGGAFGFLNSLKTVINRVLPDRVIVFWDGYQSGRLRYEIYKPYKANRKKTWAHEDEVLSNEGVGNRKEKEEFDIITQKFKVKNYLEELFVRQLEVDLIEADDLIAHYILVSNINNEQITIFSRDNDFLQLISEKVSVLNPDSLFLITHENFQKTKGYTIENELLLKCFEGDSSDTIKGVKGVTKKKLIKYFPDIAKEKYLYRRLVEEAYEKKKTKKLKVYDDVINSEEIVYRNAKLMNLKKPFINEETKKKMQHIIHDQLDSNRSVHDAMKMFIRDGYSNFVGENNLESFFAPFYRIMSKEKEYANNIKS